MRDTDQKWQIDKHVPVAVIVTVLVQTLAAIWWLSGIGHRLNDHEKRINMSENARASERLHVLESQFKDSKELQIEMNRKLDLLLAERRK
jgi:hypothetical protein